MLPSHLRNAAAVILATAMASFGAWSQEWPCMNTSFSLVQTNGSATSYNEDLWEAWKERVNASGLDVYNATTMFYNIYIKSWQTNVFTSNSFTYSNVVAVWKTDTNYWAPNAAFPTNLGKYRIMFHGGAAGGWVDLMQNPADIYTFAGSNKALPALSGIQFQSSFPALVLSSVDTNTRPFTYSWIAPEYGTNAAVRVNQFTLYNGFQDTNGWKKSFNASTINGYPSHEPVIAFAQPRNTNAPNGYFTIVGYVPSTSWLYGVSNTVMTQMLSAVSATNALAYRFTSIISITNTGAATGVTAAIFFPTNTTRVMVPISGSNAQATAFNAEYYALKALQFARFEAHGWVPYNAVKRSSYYGEAVASGSNVFTSARSAAYSALYNTTKVLNTNTEYVTILIGDDYTNVWTNAFAGDQGTYDFNQGGETKSAYSIDYNETPFYPASSNRPTYTNTDLVMGTTTVYTVYQGPGLTNGTTVTSNGVSYNWYTWAGLEYTKPGPNTTIRAFRTDSAYTGYWATVTNVLHDAQFFYAITDTHEIYDTTNNTAYKLRVNQNPVGGVVRDQWVKGPAPIFGDWTPAEVAFSTNGTTRTFKLGNADAMYRYDYTRP